MTANQSLVIAQLRRRPMRASALSHLLGWPLDAVYTELVALEAQGKARVSIGYCDGKVISREWEAK